MAEHVWTVLCQSTMIEPETKVVSLVNVTEKLTLRPIPGDDEVERNLERARSEGKRGLSFPVQLRLVSWWVRTDPVRPETVSPRISLQDSTGEHLLEQEVRIDLDKYNSQRLTLHLDALQITKFGRYWFVVEQPKGAKNKAKWVTVARIPLDIEEAVSSPDS